MRGNITFYGKLTEIISDFCLILFLRGSGTEAHFSYVGSKCFYTAVSKYETDSCSCPPNLSMVGWLVVLGLTAL